MASCWNYDNAASDISKSLLVNPVQLCSILGFEFLKSRNRPPVVICYARVRKNNLEKDSGQKPTCLLRPHISYELLFLGIGFDIPEDALRSVLDFSYNIWVVLLDINLTLEPNLRTDSSIPVVLSIIRVRAVEMLGTKSNCFIIKVT